MWDEAIARIEAEVEEKGAVHRQWNIIKGWADRKKTTQAQREELVAALAERGLATYPMLSAVNPAAKDKVRIFREVDRAKHFGLRFQTEAEFEHTIVAGFERIEELQGVKVVEKQYRLPDNKRIDVLGKRGKTWVVIEVERESGHMETPTQVLGYIRSLRATRLDDGTPLVKDDHKIEAIVITQSDSEDSRKALTAIAKAHSFSASWLVLQIRFTRHKLT